MGIHAIYPKPRLSKKAKQNQIYPYLLKGLKIKGSNQVWASDIQYTSEKFIQILRENDIEISMDSRGRVFDNIFTERLWRSVKYEEVHIKDYSDVREAKEGIESYFKFYNNERPHQSLGYNTPYEVYYGL